MSDNIGNLYVRTRADSEDDQGTSSPKKSTSLSSLRNLRDTFKRSESTSSQTTSANNGPTADVNQKKEG